jgi:hypothetical protein
LQQPLQCRAPYARSSSQCRTGIPTRESAASSPEAAFRANVSGRGTGRRARPLACGARAREAAESAHVSRYDPAAHLMRAQVEPSISDTPAAPDGGVPGCRSVRYDPPHGPGPGLITAFWGYRAGLGLLRCGVGDTYGWRRERSRPSCSSAGTETSGSPKTPSVPAPGLGGRCRSGAILRMRSAGHAGPAAPWRHGPADLTNNGTAAFRRRRSDPGLRPAQNPGPAAGPARG